MSRSELEQMVADGKIKEHHTSYFRGYVRRTGEPPTPMAYDGKFGKGYTVCKPNWGSTRYSFVTYYIFTR